MTSLTQLRNNLYQEIDQLIATGVPIEIPRKGHIIKIILDDAPSKFSRLKSRKRVVVGDPEAIIYNNHLEGWHGDLP